MSQQKLVEVVQRAFAAWNRGDIDAFLAHLCLDVEC
jgi:ketosteroid isomerase-like protein